MSAIAMDVAPSFGNKPEFVFSVNCPDPLLRNKRVPFANPVTSKSLSPSPSTSSISAPVEYCLGQVTPEVFEMSSNFQPPKFRYSLLSVCNPQKYTSANPSPSISPIATPDPFAKFRFFATSSRESLLANWTPVFSGEVSRNPSRSLGLIVNLAKRWEPRSCHCNAWPSAANARYKHVRGIKRDEVTGSPPRLRRCQGVLISRSLESYKHADLRLAK